MKIIYPFVIMVFALATFSACVPVKSVVCDAQYFSNLPQSEKKKYYKATRKIIIQKLNGNSYYLSNWKYEEIDNSISGYGVCIKDSQDTIQSGYLKVELVPNDYIIVKMRENKGTEILYIVIGVAALIGITVLTYEPSVPFILK